MNSCFVIAEAGVNHNGSEKLALELVEVAAKSGANAVKFQTFKAINLVAKGTAKANYQKEQTGSGDQYSMLEKLEMTEELHHKLVVHCKKYDIEFMSTAFDVEAASFLISLGMEILKVPSGELTNHPFISELASFNKPMILSTGMSTLDEVKESVDVIRDVRNKCGFTDPIEQVLTILHCTSNYPTRNEDVNLKAMQTMANKLLVPVGYSDHTDGLLASVASVAMGATIVEKHFTLDRNLPGPDHKASLEPNELKLMVQQIRQIEACLGDGVKAPRESELPVRELVRRSVTLSVDKVAGDVIKEEDLQLLRPGMGIPPKQLQEVIGKRVKSSLTAGTTLIWQHLN